MKERDAKDWEPVCAERVVIREGRRDGWAVLCTRLAGHAGDHIARDEAREIFRWPPDVLGADTSAPPAA